MTTEGREPAERSSCAIDTVVFDLGGVLIEWDPRRVYRSLLADDEAVDAFLAEVRFLEWNALQDGGRSFADGVAELSARFPHHAELIRVYPERFTDSLGDAVPGTAQVVDELADRGVRLLALTNWSAETFHHGRARLPVLDRFEAVVVSGEIRIAKPDPRIFEHVVTRFGLEPARTVFIDDSPANVAAAADTGMVALRFTDAATLRAELVARGLLAPRA